MVHLLLLDMCGEYLRANYIVYNFFYEFVNKKNGNLYLTSFFDMVEKSDLSEDEKRNIIMVLFKVHHSSFVADYFACHHWLDSHGSPDPDFFKKEQKAVDEMIELMKQSMSRIDSLDDGTIKKYEGAVLAVMRKFGFDENKYVEDERLNREYQCKIANAYEALLTNTSIKDETITFLSSVLNEYTINLLKENNSKQKKIIKSKN